MANKTPLSGRFSTYAQKLVAAGQAGKEMVFFPTDEVNETGHSYEFTPQGLYSYITDNLPSGSGLGDMVSTTYDPNNIKKDVYNLAYATGSLSPTKVTGLAHIATSGSWFDIINRPTFATVATTGDYDDLLNKPTLGTASASDAGDFATAAQGAKADSAVQSVIGGSGISVDNTDPQNPVIVSTVTGNVAGDIHNADPKASPVDADELPVVDTEDLNILKKFTIANLKSLLESYFDTLYAPAGSTGDVAGDTHAADTKATPHDDDEMPLIDSEDSFSLKKLTWDDIKTALKTYFDGLYTGNTGTVTSVGATVPTGLQVSGSPVTTSGTLAISYASGYQGYTSAEASKLSGIESSADVTDAGNVGSAIHGADAKTTPVDADTIALIDSAASNVLKKLSWSNIKATLKTYFDTLYAEVSVYDPTGIEGDAFDRANHHGTQTASTISDFSAAVLSELSSYIAAQDVLVFKGGIDASSNPNYPAADAGHVYKITVAGKIGGASGPSVGVGDVLTCTVDSSAAGDHATVGANWLIIQVNTDGVVIGPASSTDNAVAGFDGTTGKVIKELSSSEIRTAAGLSTSDSPQFTALNIGHASDTTLARVSAGVISVEGKRILTGSEENQPITGGATVTSKSLGTQSSGTLTLDVGDCALQHYTNNGAHTLAPGTVTGAAIIDITNGASAGAITVSGWTKVSGDSFTTTNGHKFRCHASVGNAGSLLVVQAMQ